MNFVHADIVDKLTLTSEPYKEREEHALTRRHAWNYQERAMYWYDPQVGRMILPDGTGKNLDSRMTFYELLNRIASHQERSNGKARAATLILRAGRALRMKPSREWFSVPDTWEQEPLKWSTLQGKYTRSGFTIHLYATGDYWQEESRVHTCYDAYHALENKLAHAFNLSHYHLRPTPASTGRDLLEISLPEKHTYSRLPDDVIDLIARNFGQGRIEHFPPAREVLGNGVYVIDGRWMYASCVSHLPIGPCYKDTCNEFIGTITRNGHMIPKVQAFYYASFQVPQDWQHIGLLQAPPINDNAYYPREPGATFTNWITAAELALAIEYGWPIHIHERLLWPDTEKITDPLATWRKKLVALRETVDDGSEQGKLLKDAIRAIFLHTIGSFHQRYTFVDHFTPRESLPLPDNARIASVGTLTPKGLRWREEVPLPSSRGNFIHPEWAATVWGRARARLAAYALQLPFQDIVSLRTDSIWCASVPEYIEKEDTGKPGAFRVKEYIAGPWVWPENAGRMRMYVIKHNLQQGDSTELDDMESREE